MRVTDIFDDYLQGKLSVEDKINFDLRIATDGVFAAAFQEHKILLEALNAQAEKAELKQTLKDIHQKEFGDDAKIISIHRQETFAGRNGRMIVIAAATAFIAVLSTVAVLSTGGYLLKQQSNQITDLNRVVMQIKASNDGIVRAMKNGKKAAVYAPANLEGSAFALNNKGYVVTSLHMVKGADSIFIQNNTLERTYTKLILSDERLDMAILKIENDSLVKNWQVPFSLKEKTSDVGEKVFTLGYPRREMVYGEGSLSALSGYSNDTSMYQISIPVNPGNSGSPLLDENGNIVGVIRGKITGAEATGFAVKACHILSAINNAATDSTKQDLLQTNKKTASSLKNLKRTEQIKRINPYVFNVLVYKQN
ncbi:MAG: trypsin-like peptidase domain-containing protein [Bacteroidetes bacterium]|nr:trypsin-like peptidase domain-containing protein [Bacteroidota bacterium]